MNLGRRSTELARVAADLVERHQPVEHVEGGVLKSLGHRRCGHLLKLPREPPLGRLVVRRRRAARWVLEKERVADEVEDLSAQERVPPLGPDDGPQDVHAVAFTDPTVDVGAVHREARDDLAQRVPQPVEREVPTPALALSQPVELVRKHMKFAGQR